MACPWWIPRTCPWTNLPSHDTGEANRGIPQTPRRPSIVIGARPHSSSTKSCNQPRGRGCEVPWRLGRLYVGRETSWKCSRILPELGYSEVQTASYSPPLTVLPGSSCTWTTAVHQRIPRHRGLLLYDRRTPGNKPRNPTNTVAPLDHDRCTGTVQRFVTSLQ